MANQSCSIANPQQDRVGGVAFAFHGRDGDVQQRASGLIAPHDGVARGRPGEDETRVKSLAAQGVIARTIGAAQDNGDLWHSRFGIGVEQFRAMADDAAELLACPGQKAWNVFKRDQRDVTRVRTSAVHTRAGQGAQRKASESKQRGAGVFCRLC